MDKQWEGFSITISQLWACLDKIASDGIAVEATEERVIVTNCGSSRIYVTDAKHKQAYLPIPPFDRERRDYSDLTVPIPFLTLMSRRLGLHRELLERLM